MESHSDDRAQLIFTTHEISIMDTDILRRNEIWFTERRENSSNKVHPFHMFKEGYEKKLSKSYLDGRYGAVPRFHFYSFSEGL